MIKFYQLVRQLPFLDDDTSISFNKELDLKLDGMVHATVVSRHLCLGRLLLSCSMSYLSQKRAEPGVCSELLIVPMSSEIQQVYADKFCWIQKGLKGCLVVMS